jgi:hypothetical protein
MLDLIALGAMIRDARLRRGWRPIDFALEMGWSGTAPVYRLERPGPDTPRPTSDTINLLAQVLELDYADRMTLLGFAGHLPDTELLTAQEEAHLVTLARPIMDSSAEPMVLFDYRIRVLAINEAFRRPFGFEPCVVASWREQGFTGFDLLWDARHGLRERLINFEELVESQMLRFKLDNRLRRHEAWYRAYPACNAHLPGFVALWERTDETLARPASEWDLARVMQRTIELQGPRGRPLRMDASRLLLHAGYGLAALGVYVPTDEVTRRWLAGPSQNVAGPVGPSSAARLLPRGQPA